MNERQPSRTALGAAGYRAAHQVLEGGKVFSDPRVWMMSLIYFAITLLVSWLFYTLMTRNDAK